MPHESKAKKFLKSSLLSLSLKKKGIRSTRALALRPPFHPKKGSPPALVYIYLLSCLFVVFNLSVPEYILTI